MPNYQQYLEVKLPSVETLVDIPKIDEMLVCLHDSKIFTILDLRADTTISSLVKN